MEIKVFNKFSEKVGDKNEFPNERKQEEIFKIPVDTDGKIEYEKISKEKQSTQLSVLYFIFDIIFIKNSLFIWNNINKKNKKGGLTINVKQDA